jgi:carboxyl-terminal processing protease
MKTLLTIIFLLFTVSVFGQPTDEKLKSLLDSVISNSKQTSLYSKTVDWAILEKQIYSKAENAKNIAELKPAFEVLLNGLRDHHGRIINAKDYSTIASFTDFKNTRNADKRERTDEIWKIVNDKDLKFEYKLLKGKIGYLKIVGIAPNVDIPKESEKIRNAVIELANQKVDKWIIDLRYNAGGNIHPMMAGIGPLIGDGIAGNVVNLANEKLFDWEIKKGNFIYAQAQPVNFPNQPQFKKRPKIAVLTSRWTVSSGEIVAVSLKGVPNTKFFGEATGGYTTNTGWNIINNEVIVVIATGILSDRNSKIYEQNIEPDVEIAFEVEKETTKDKGIIAAAKWLKK